MKFLLAMLILTACTEAPKTFDRKSGARDEQGPRTPPALAKIQDIMYSQISRSRGSERKSHTEIRNDISSDILAEKDYRIIPNPVLDNTGAFTKAPVPSNECGSKEIFSSVKARLNNCVINNPGQNLWDGQANGNAGESDWSLVSFSIEENTAVWLDEKTGLLWSPSLARVPWNEASGFQVAAESFICGQYSVYPEGQVKWRLPTRNEVLQADIDGIKAISFDMEAGELFWTATSDVNTNNAWAIDVAQGILVSVDKKSLLEVRCVGEITK